MYENKKIYVLGMARSGYEVAKLLANKNNEIIITDIKLKEPKNVLELTNLGVKIIETKEQSSFLDESFDLLIKNPGISLDNETVKKAESLNIPVINEVEVAYEFLKNNTIIGVTGSNGKTTTTTLIYEFLKSELENVLLGGNVGYPVCSLVEKANDESILVLEISSHQLTNIINFKTDISVLTNLSPVHLDHFGTYESYKANKMNIFNLHTDKDLVILNEGDEEVMEYTKNIPSKRITFSSTKSSDLYIKDNAIYYKDEHIVDLDDILIKGNHNYENIMCAIAVSKEFGISNGSIKNILKTFKGVHHRLEYVDTINDVRYFNDSKATNTESTKVALNSFKSPVILLLGGLDRGHSFEPLTPYMDNVKLIVSFGETKDRIADFAQSINKPVIVTDTLDVAFNKAVENSVKGDSILLSPSCASWDQFEKFEDRGDFFKEQAKKLKEQ